MVYNSSRIMAIVRLNPSQFYSSKNRSFSQKTAYTQNDAGLPGLQFGNVIESILGYYSSELFDNIRHQNFTYYHSDRDGKGKTSKVVALAQRRRNEGQTWLWGGQIIMSTPTIRSDFHIWMNEASFFATRYSVIDGKPFCDYVCLTKSFGGINFRLNTVRTSVLQKSIYDTSIVVHVTEGETASLTDDFHSQSLLASTYLHPTDGILGLNGLVFNPLPPGDTSPYHMSQLLPLIVPQYDSMSTILIANALP